MTEEDRINIALAELYGWTDIKEDPDYQEFTGIDPDGGRERWIPKYWNDACTFEALWPRLTEDKKEQFVDELCDIIDREDHPKRYIGEGCSAFFATARQRVEAMLRVFDKWKD
jgi:hypothetical protein